MDHSFLHSILRRRALAGLMGAWFAASPLLFAQDASPDEITVIDHGQRHTLVIADREVYVARRKNAPLGELRQLLERVPGSKVAFDTETRALVQLGRPVDRARSALSTDEVSTALPDAEIDPVLYIKGAPRTETTRRYGTDTLLVARPAGRTLAQLAKQHGALDAQATSRPGLVLLRYATPFKALHAVQELRAAGVDAQPMLARQMEKRAAAPLDQFFPQQWHLANVGQGGGTFGIDANVLGAWDYTLGTGSTIALVDDCLQTTHPDVTQNCPPIQTNLHHDFIDKDNDPRPGVNDLHGMSCAGVAAARQNNGNPDPNTGALLGVSGSAPSARLLGLRLIAGPFTDADSASALYWHPGTTVVGVSTNSWGPTDGAGLAGPDILTVDALKKATEEGRTGLGQVTLFAAGNGRLRADNSNFDGYANSRYVTAVSAITNFGLQSIYSEPGANILVCAPSDGGSLGITTTDLVGVNGYNPTLAPNGPPNLPNTDYTNDFGGTSAACPLVAGGAALMLSANPNLGWRDVREILAATARKIDDGDADWMMRPPAPGQDVLTNAGGFHFNHKFGAGLIDLTAAVVRAQTWENLPTEVFQKVALSEPPAINPQVPVVIPGDGNLVSFPLDFSANPNLRVEIAALKIYITTDHRSDLQIELVSPSGVRSVLSPRRARPNPNTSLDGDIDIANWVLDAENGRLIEQAEGWTFTSSHYWADNSKITPPGGAPANGVWTLNISNLPAGGEVPVDAVLNSASLALYGTPAGESRIVFDDGSSGDISEKGGSKTIRVRRLGPLGGEATVNYATTVGSATPDGNGVLNPDYTPVSGTLHFSDGQVFADTDITIPILDDTLPELNETVNVVLTQPTNATLGRASLFSFRILDDEKNEVTVFATDPTAAETVIGVPADTGTFTIQRELATDLPITVNFTLTGTATMGTGPNGTGDYTPIPLSATIPAFSKSVDVVISPRNDSTIEGTETVILTLTPDVSYQVGLPSQAQIDLIDNDRQKVQIGIPFPGGDIAAENPKKTTTVRITRAREIPNVPPPNPLTVLLSYEGTQINGINYQPLPTTIIMDAGAGLPNTTDPVPGVDYVDLLIDPINDSFYQATKSVIVRLLPSNDYDFQFGFLTSARVTIREDDPIPDTHIPVATISTPKNKAQYPAPQQTLTASGTASDNSLVEKVVYRLNEGPWKLANLTTQPAKNVNWNVDILLNVVRGPNTLNVKSVDDAGNESKIATSNFDYVEEHKLTIAINPVDSGTVSKGFAPDSQRESGRAYTITAYAAEGQVFDYWSGLMDFGFPKNNSSDRTLTFTMPLADATLTANFVPSPYGPEIAGNYSGLAEAPNFGTETSGFLKITVNPNGFYTGKLTYSGVVYPIKGDFTGSGLSQLIIPRKKSTSLIVTLNIDTTVAGGTRQITGTIEGASAVSNLVADRAAYSKTVAAPAGLVTNYTLVLPPADPLADPQHHPHGNGIGTMTIGADGIVKWAGTLADGTKVRQTQPLTKDNTWPVFLKLYGGKGVALGNVQQVLTPNVSDLNGKFDWQKPIKSKDKNFPLGFRIIGADLIGSTYTAPGAGIRALGGFADATNNGFAAITDGSLQSNFTKNITLDTANQITVEDTVAAPNPTKLKFEINVAKGTFSGSFIHPISQKKTPINGVLFQRQEKAAGLFIGQGVPGSLPQTGRVTIGHP